MLDLREEHPVSRAGGKAAALGRLLQRGTAVPPALCIPVDAYLEHAQRCGLSRELSRVSPQLGSLAPGRRAALLARWRSQIERSPVAPELARDLQRSLDQLGGSVAIRSSSSGEDGTSWSAAGLHDSFLGITSLEEAIDCVKRCWSSLWSDRAVAYGEHALSRGQLPVMAVVVQLLVTPRVAGVIFTRNPADQAARDAMNIEAVRGSGEALVSGRVTPERWRVSRDIRVLHREDSLDGDSPPLLQPEEVRAIARLARDIERDEGVSQDIEWCLDGEVLFVLQSRPITGLAPEPPNLDVWSNINSGEVLPDVTSPMGWDLVLPVERILRKIIMRFGVDLEDHSLIDRIAGRAYFNVSTLAGALRSMPFGSTVDLGLLLGGAQGSAGGAGGFRISRESIPSIRGGWSGFLRAFPGLVRWMILHRPSRAPGSLRRLREEYARLAGVELRELTWSELHGYLEEIITIIFADEEGCLSHVVIGSSFFMGLDWFCRTILRKHPHLTAMGLLAGQGGMASADAGHALWSLAHLASEDPTIRKIVEQQEDHVAAWRDLADSGSGEFTRAWARFMEEHGHHARGEVEVHNPRWSDEPDYVYRLVRSYVLSMETHDFGEVMDDRRRRSDVLVEECRSRIPAPLRPVFAMLLRKTRESSAFRENAKSECVRFLALARRALMVMGDRLVGQGALMSPEEVFFLTRKELRSARGGSSLQARIQYRQSEHARFQQITPPPVIQGKLDIESLDPSPAVGDLEEVLTGIAASGGTAEGPARVIARDDQHSTIYPGEILVAPHTDPGWTPYFVPAAGLVTDLGGLLSHGCIVAREYGLPAVVNTGDATRQIRTGDWLFLDGNSGTVRIVRSSNIPRPSVERS